MCRINSLLDTEDVQGESEGPLGYKLETYHPQLGCLGESNPPVMTSDLS